MQHINNTTHATTLRLLQIEIAELSDDLGAKELEKECLNLGKSEYEHRRNWQKVVRYQRRIETLDKEARDIKEYLDMRLIEYRRLSAEAEKLKNEDSCISKNPKLSII